MERETCHTIRRTAGLVVVLTCFGLMTSSAKGQTAAPVPAQIATAKNVFIANAGTDINSLNALRQAGDDGAETYDEFYADMKAWGRYAPVSSPENADLVFEIRFSTTISGCPNNYARELTLTIVDVKTHFLLWKFTEPVLEAGRESNWKKNLSAGIIGLVNDMKSIAGPKAGGAVTLPITGTSGGTPVDLSSSYNVTGIYDDGSKFAREASLDGIGFALSEQLVGPEQVADEVSFTLGPPDAPDAVTGATVPLLAGNYSALKMLAVGVNGSQETQNFVIAYTDGTSASFTQSLSDWYYPSHFSGESAAVNLRYRVNSDGGTDEHPGGNIYAYSFNLDNSKQVRSISLPDNRNVVVLAMTLVPRPR